MNLLLLCILGYLVGSIPTGFLLTKFFGGVDVRYVGSHSTGATNVLRSGHKILALITLLVDGLKGMVLAFVTKEMLGNSQYLIVAFCCLIGHVFPIWLGFKGGKGVATSAGIFVVASPLFASISIIIWAIVAKVIKISSLASIALSVSFTSLCLYGYIFKDTDIDIFLFSIIALAFLLLTHFRNIKRIIHKNETTVDIK